MKFKEIYNQFFFFGLFIISLTSCATKDKIIYSKSLERPSLEFLWETDTLLTDIESVIYHKEKDILYTTSINGNWLKKGGVGFVSKVDLTGNIVKHKWINNLEGPTGTTIYDNKLYIADFENVVEVAIDKNKISNTIFIEGTRRINDLTITNNGIIYGTGTLNGILFSIENNKATILKNDLARPNGILAKKDGLLLGLTGSKTVGTYNLNNKITSVFADSISNADGISTVGNGDYLVSSWQGLIYYVYKDGSKKLLLDTSKEGINAADIHYIASKNILLVPAMLKHKLMAYKLVDND